MSALRNFKKGLNEFRDIKIAKARLNRHIKEEQDKPDYKLANKSMRRDRIGQILQRFQLKVG